MAFATPAWRPDSRNPCKKQLGIMVLSGWFRRWGARDRRIPVAPWLSSLAYKTSSRPVRDSAKGTKRTEPEEWPLRLSSGLQLAARWRRRTKSKKHWREVKTHTVTCQDEQHLEGGNRGMVCAGCVCTFALWSWHRTQRHHERESLAYNKGLLSCSKAWTRMLT